MRVPEVRAFAGIERRLSLEHNPKAGACKPQRPSAHNPSCILFLMSLTSRAMYTPIHSSPRLELRPKWVTAEHAIMDANRLVHKGDYEAAIGLYNRLLDERCHPVYYLNRALCFIATNQPHLAVNDALRAYIMAQCVIDAIRNNGEVNDHVRRIDAHIITYAGMSKHAAIP